MSEEETFVPALAIADILAVIRHLPVSAVAVFQVARYRCLSLDHSDVVAVVDDCASQQSEA